MSTREKNAEESRVLAFLRSRARDEADSVESTKGRRVSLNMAREQLFLEQFKEAASSIFKDKVPISKYASAIHKTPKSRILNVLLSDLHYGANLDGREVPHEYGPIEEARRTAAIAVQVADYKRQYREETVLYVHLLGDLIQGQLHDMRDGAPLAEQVARAVRMLVQAISYWSSQFPKVQVRCTPGNHGRNTMRHKERATNQKWDSIETMIYISIKEAMRTVPNVTVEIPLTPYYTCKAFNSYAFFTHGDTVIQPGYPSKSINVQGLRKQINEWNSVSENKCQLFAVGHVHTGSIIKIPSGASVITNGSLIPTDAYGLSIGAFDTHCGQWLWESVEGHVVGDSRFIEVNADIDKEKALDKLIRPFTAL